MCSSDAELRHLLRLERLRIVEHLAVAVAEDVGRVPALDAEEARLEAGREDRLHQRLAGLEVLAADRHAVLLGQLEQRGRVDGQVGRAVGVRHAALERRVGVDLRRRDLRIALRQPLLERGQRRVHGRRAAIDLGRSAPHHHQPIAAVVLLEALDVLDHLLGEIGLRLARLLVRRGELLDVLLIEHGRHRLDRRQEVLERRQVLLRQHAGLARPPRTRRREDSPSRRTRCRRAWRAARTHG